MNAQTISKCGGFRISGSSLLTVIALYCACSNTSNNVPVVPVVTDAGANHDGSSNTGTGGLGAAGVSGTAGSGVAGISGTAGMPETGGTGGTSTFVDAGADGGAEVDAGPPRSELLAMCQSCQQAAFVRDDMMYSNCGPMYVSASSTAGTWGCSSLPKDEQKAACNALLTCINTKNCAVKDSPTPGCWCNKDRTLAECLVAAAGSITGACGAEYRNAAIADGVAPGSPDAVFSATIGGAFDGTTAVGLADNLFTCASDALCPICNGL